MTSRRLALAALALAVDAASAAADGERSPMIGIAAVGADLARGPDRRVEAGGVALDVAWWRGRFGLAGELSERWTTDGARATVLGGSARVLVVKRLVADLFDPRDIELGVELHAIAERAWWSAGAAVDPMSYGLGLAIRLRGGAGDPDASTLLAESRLFVRATASRWSAVEISARGAMASTTMTEPAFAVLAGIGASFGSGAPGYVRRFRPRLITHL